jgi:hypothetical protein
MNGIRKTYDARGDRETVCVCVCVCGWGKRQTTIGTRRAPTRSITLLQQSSTRRTKEQRLATLRYAMLRYMGQGKGPYVSPTAVPAPRGSLAPPQRMAGGSALAHAAARPRMLPPPAPAGGLYPRRTRPAVGPGLRAQDD